MCRHTKRLWPLAFSAGILLSACSGDRSPARGGSDEPGAPAEAVAAEDPAASEPARRDMIQRMRQRSILLPRDEQVGGGYDFWAYENDCTDEDLANIRKIGNVKEVYLQSGFITDRSLAHLEGLDEIESLIICHSDYMTDDGLVHLKSLPNLKSLVLVGTSASFPTEKGLAHLKGLVGLEDLTVSGSGVTDAALIHFAGLTSLRRVELSNTKVTDAGVRELQRALPSVKIVRK